MIEHEGVLCGKLARANTEVMLADIGADGCVSSSSKSENLSSSREMIFIIYSIIIFWIIVDCLCAMLITLFYLFLSITYVVTFVIMIISTIIIKIISQHIQN